jgi:hypothetical protein
LISLVFDTSDVHILGGAETQASIAEGRRESLSPAAITAAGR